MVGKSAIFQHFLLAVVNLIFSTVHGMSCKKGGFIYIRHNNLRDLTANMISEVCKETKIEPKLSPLSGEELQSRTSNNSNKGRVDIKTRFFWE